MTPEVLSALVGEIYDCALDGERWSSALTQVAASMDAAYAAVHLFEPTDLRKPPRLAASSPWDRSRLEELNRRFAPNGIPGVEGVYQGPIDSPVSSIDRVGEESFKQSIFYKEWAGPQGLLDGAATKFVHEQNRIGIFSCVTRDRRAPMGEDERRFIALLCPHLRRAALVGDLLDHKRVEAGTFRDTLDSLFAPLILVDANARIVFANARGEALLRRGGLIHSADGRLQTGTPAVSQALADAIRRAGRNVLDLGGHGIGLPLTGPGEQPAVAYVLPLHGSDVRQAHSGAVASVFIALSRSAARLPTEQVLQTMYGVTPAEARVMQMVAQSHKPSHIAAALGVSENTVKSHLARVFAKSDTKTQAEVVELMARLSPPAGSNR